MRRFSFFLYILIFTGVSFLLTGCYQNQDTPLNANLDENFQEERFLIPLDLTMTEPSNKRILPGLAAGYTDKSNPFGFPIKSTAADGRLAWHPGIEWTGGGLVSNSGDLARWGSALFSGRAMPGDYLNRLLDSVPIHPETPDHRYGAGVSINRAGRFGPVYGHGGWIPGYSSSLGYYADYGVAVAIQINTDRDITDGETPVMQEMENGLAEIVISAIQEKEIDTQN